MKHTEGHFCGTDYKVDNEKLLGRKICLGHIGREKWSEQKKLIVHKIFAFASTFNQLRVGEFCRLRTMSNLRNDRKITFFARAYCLVATARQ